MLIPAGEQRIIKTGEQSRQPNKHSVARISQITSGVAFQDLGSAALIQKQFVDGEELICKTS